MSEEIVEKPVVKAITAFMVIQAENGAFYAVNDLNTELEVQRKATLLDMKTGCREIGDAFIRTDIINAVKGLLTPKSEEPVATSIREALDERGIL